MGVIGPQPQSDWLTEHDFAMIWGVRPDNPRGDLPMLALVGPCKGCGLLLKNYVKRLERFGADDSVVRKCKALATNGDEKRIASEQE